MTRSHALKDDGPIPGSKVPRVFLSYSHDSGSHKKRVLDLADQLRRDGVDARLDQYEVSPSAGWASWMDQEIGRADSVLVVCTETYAERFQRVSAKGKGVGVKWEGALITLAIYEAEGNAKFVPIIFSTSDRRHIPRLLRDTTCYDLGSADGYELLYRRLTKQPEVMKPRLGDRIDLPTTNIENTQRSKLGGVQEMSHGDPEDQALVNSLEEAYRRRTEIRSEGKDAAQIQQVILKLRRRLREGGQLKAGDYLLDGRFQLIDRLGQGGFATVWKAYDRNRREFVAIKVLHGQFAYDRSRLERFFRGARRMAGLHHQRIVRVIDEQLEDDGFHFFTMEYLPGGDLRKAVLAGRMPPARALQVILSVGEALQFAHSQDMIHRDVKPANILLDDHGQPLLTDFDLVRAMDSTGGTRTGMLGTVIYSAPEVMERPQDATFSADVYGLGMTAVFSLSGADLGFSVFRETEVLIDSLDTTKAVKSALKQAIAWRPEKRFPSVESFCAAVRGAIEAQSKLEISHKPRERDVSPETWIKVRGLFEAALDHRPETRTDFLTETVGDDSRLSEEVGELLEGFDETESVLAVPISEIRKGKPEGLEVMEGRRVGSYRLMRKIGQGGMGSVYLAERADDIFCQQVAVKLVQVEVGAMHSTSPLESTT